MEALPAKLREQVEQTWTNRDGRLSDRQSPSPQPSSPLPQSPSLMSRPASPPLPSTSAPVLFTPLVGTLVLQIPHQPNSPGIVLELPNFSQVFFLHLKGNLGFFEVEFYEVLILEKQMG